MQTDTIHLKGSHKSPNPKMYPRKDILPSSNMSGARYFRLTGNPHPPNNAQPPVYYIKGNNKNMVQVTPYEVSTPVYSAPAPHFHPHVPSFTQVYSTAYPQSAVYSSIQPQVQNLLESTKPFLLRLRHLLQL